MDANQAEASVAPLSEAPLLPRADLVVDLPAKRQRSRQKRLLLIGAVLLGLCLVASASLYTRITSQKGGLEATIDGFMLAASRGDLDGAYQQFSTRAKLGMPFKAFQEVMSEESMRVSVTQYHKCQAKNIELSWASNTDKIVPQGQVANVSGTQTYRGGHSGTFEAVLEREGSEWKLFSIHLQVSPQQ